MVALWIDRYGAKPQRIASLIGIEPARQKMGLPGGR